MLTGQLDALRAATSRRDARPWLTALRALLIALGLLLPLNLPFSVPPVTSDRLFGWTTSSTPAVDDGAAPATVIHTTRHGRAAGLRPGDVLLLVAGLPATEATLSRIRQEAEAGDTLLMRVRRGSEVLDLAVPVAASVAAYTGYIAYRVLVVLGAWVVGMGLLIWRGRQPAAVLLGGALILLAPGAFPNGVPGSGAILDMARSGWQVLGAAEAIFVPLLLCHFLALHLRGARATRSPALWVPLYAAALVVLWLVTDGLVEPLARSRGDFAFRLRHVAGGIGAVLAMLAAVAILIRQRTAPPPLRWLALAIIAYMGVSFAYSSISVFETTIIDAELVRRGRAVVLTLLPVTAAFRLHPSAADRGAFAERQRLTTYTSVLVAALYAAAVAGAAAVVLSATQTSLGGIEWLLFLAIFTTAFVFLPVTRWAREFVDRRMFAHWLDKEAQARALVERLAAELDPERIARRAADAVPALLEVGASELVLDAELVRSWEVPEDAGIGTATREELRQLLAHHGETEVVLPIAGRDSDLAGVLVLRRRRPAVPLSPPELAIARTIAHGLSSALRNAATYVELRRAQRELAEAERINAIGALAGGLAHEIKNPLASLKMGLHLIERDGIDGTRLRRIHWDVRRIDDLVSGLLHYSDDATHDESGTLDLPALARACVEELRALADTRGIRIIERYPPGKALAVGAPGRVRLVISNLLMNALDAVDENGYVELGIRVDGAHVELLMRDTGTGIPPQYRDQVFRFSFSTKPGGTGLGLALARREIDRLRGSIELVDGDGRGTTLRVLLPRAIYPAHVNM